ncbi:MAG: biopolymer transporter ExbD [Bacteroidota bacterium]
MGIKKRNKVSAEFSMSSLTDIIFLLLIFFMLTSNLVAPNALNLKLPGKSNPTVSSSNPPDVRISRDGTFYLDNRKMSSDVVLSSAIRRLRNSNGGKTLDVTISPHPDSPVEKLVTVMDIAMRLKVNAILATEE